jgi:hypothetical protein
MELADERLEELARLVPGVRVRIKGTGATGLAAEDPVDEDVIGLEGVLVYIEDSPPPWRPSALYTVNYSDDTLMGDFYEDELEVIV